MSAPTSPSATLPPARVPAGVRALLDRLADAGHPSVLVGGCVRDLLEGRPVHDFDVATPAPAEAVLDLFPRAVPIGLRHGTVMVPTPDGPVDVTHFRGGPRLEDDLARRDFTLNALAWHPDGEVVDPFGGRADLAAGRLRAVGDADARLAEDPLRALRAARLVAERGFAPDPELEAALARVAARLADVAGERLRAEIERLLLGDHAPEALRLLRRTGLEAALAPRASAQAPERVAAMPRERDARLAAWLVGTPARRVLARLRAPHATATRIARVLAEHPVHARTDPHRPPAVRRLLHRFAAEDVALLLRLAEAEARLGGAPEARARVAALADAVAREQARAGLALGRADLALDGEVVMGILGIGPGPEVGRALRYLTECVLDDPGENEPARLRARLETWAAEQGLAHDPEEDRPTCAE